MTTCPKIKLEIYLDIAWEVNANRESYEYSEIEDLCDDSEQKPRENKWKLNFRLLTGQKL